MPYSNIVSNPAKRLHGAFESQPFIVPYSSTPVAAPGSLSGNYQAERFVAPPFFSQPGGMGFDMSTVTTWLGGSTTIGSLAIPNIALAALPLLFLVMGKKGRR